jgi:hypothetical protein
VVVGVNVLSAIAVISLLKSSLILLSASVIDLISVVVELLERDINRLVVEAREALELVNYGIRGGRVI